MKAHQTTVGLTDEWITPQWILKPLGKFDLDPCAAINQPWSTAGVQWTEQGLSSDWFGRVWLNPPFNRYQRPMWMAKMAQHNNGIMLIPAACETRPFQSHVFGKASGILMLGQRPHFCDINGIEAEANSGCTICLIAYGKENLLALLNSGLGTVLKEVA